MTFGHDGGGILTVPSGYDDAGKLLFGVGDCLPFGWNGLAVPQVSLTLCNSCVAHPFDRRPHISSQMVF